MKGKDKNTNNFLATILLFVVFLSQGYALLGQELNTTGVTNFDNTSWSIHFVGSPTDSFSEASGSVVGTHSYSSDYKSLSFNDSLSIPGDFYEFTVDITNDGGIDGMLENVPTLSIVDNKGTSDTSDDVSYTNTNIITSSITYSDGTPLNQYDELNQGDILTYKIKIEFKKNIENTDLVDLPLHLTFTLEPTYVQSDSNAKKTGTIINESTDCSNNTLLSTVPSNLNGLAKIMANQAYLDNSRSEFVSSCSGVKFSAISSNTNGKGVYEIASTKDDTYPIYYYRGAVTNNNVLFANFCWKAVRTTNTGGVKLIYNGTPNNGQCTNTTGDATQIENSQYNYKQTSPAHVGYMYGTAYMYSNKALSDLNVVYLYGNDAIWDGTNYTLTDTITSSGIWENDYNTLNNNHYTCFTDGTTCSKVYYIYFTNLTRGAYYITLTNGKKVEDALSDMIDASDANTFDSTIKTNIDTWYSNNMTSYTNKIEDTIYCNDRTINSLGGWNPNGGQTIEDSYLRFNGFKKTFINHTPSLNCIRVQDRFTVNSSIGNGSLTYPVGLLTTDEIMYAGATGSSNNMHYLYTGEYWWTMSPGSFYSYYGSEALVNQTGNIYGDTIQSSHGIRPVISLASTNVISQGDGTANNPYVVY